MTGIVQKISSGVQRRLADEGETSVKRFNRLRALIRLRPTPSLLTVIAVRRIIRPALRLYW